MLTTEIQSILKSLGIYSGNIDGVKGEKTVEAIKAFQARYGLDIDGIVGTLTERALITIVSLDANSPLPAYIPYEHEMESYYGKPGTNQVLVEFPYDMYYDGSLVKKFTINAKAAPSALSVLQQVAQIYSQPERKSLGLDIFCGCYAPRNKRGGTTLSTHAYACAIDFDQERNQQHWHADKARLAQLDAIPFWQAWEAVGWVSLGRAKNYDWMHIQRAR